MKQAPEDTEITLAQLDEDPFPIYRRLRLRRPLCRSKRRTHVYNKSQRHQICERQPEIFSSNDPNTPMRRAFWAHTLMRKDGQEHLRERMAMAPSFAPKVIRDEWVPEYEKIAKEYVARLPRGEVVDLFSALSGPYAARGLAIVLGIDAATDDQMQRWSQALIDGAGNFGWKDAPFQRADRANEEMHRLFDSLLDRHRAKTNNSAMSVMLNADDPIEKKQIYANIKIAIGGGINEPRDALNTVLFGLLSNPEHLEEVKRNADWDKAFEEGIRWVAPISASSRLVVEDTEIRGCFIPKGDVVMTIQASANRDEDLFDDGESFFVYRNTNPHQSFGMVHIFAKELHCTPRGCRSCCPYCSIAFQICPCPNQTPLSGAVLVFVGHSTSQCC
ncbi:cytochrome P450 [Planktomarina sp.]|uniref:cytochrome P450 n=1 Tax=Planktomarina sp. TaxID=2024851 RepID=UPI003260CE77